MRVDKGMRLSFEKICFFTVFKQKSNCGSFRDSKFELRIRILQIIPDPTGYRSGSDTRVKWKEKPQHTQPAGLELLWLDPFLKRVVGDEVPDELLVGLVQLPALPLPRTEYLAVVQRVVGNRKPEHIARSRSIWEDGDADRSSRQNSGVVLT